MFTAMEPKAVRAGGCPSGCIVFVEHFMHMFIFKRLAGEVVFCVGARGARRCMVVTTDDRGYHKSGTVYACISIL